MKKNLNLEDLSNTYLTRSLFQFILRTLGTQVKDIRKLYKFTFIV